MKDKLYSLFKQCFFVLQYSFLNLRKSWIRYRMRQGKQSWFISAAELEQGLQNIEHKILNKHKYLKRSIPINKESTTFI
ncbi:hypothetical protein [Rickettsia asembonensis]|uniref:hypothetical protein n=1 Tax=Rickettsia asembonensis TaxID=1068590 RepID=UPI0023F931FF|nr:hypothetical protein [Rickettsia asembonensis]